MKKINILQVLPELNYGGVEIEAVTIAKYLAQKGHGSFIASNGGVLLQELKQPGITHFKMHLSSKNPIKILMNAFRLVKLIRINNIDVIHARSRAPAWSAYLACRATNTGFVTTFHGVYGSGNPLKRWYNSVMLKGYSVIAISNFIKKHIETRYHFISERLKVINRGVDLNKFSPDKVSKNSIKEVKKQLGCTLKGKVILLPARFTRLKGHLYLLSALKYIKKIEYTCIMVGTHSDRHIKYVQEIENAIKEYGLQSNVFICQAIGDMPALYSLSDIVVSSSIEPEAFGRTVIEAQAMGKIVVATSLGASNEIIDNEKTGFLVSSTNSYELAKALQDVLSLKEKEYLKIQTSALNKVKKQFSIDGMCEQTLSVYKELIQ